MIALFLNAIYAQTWVVQLPLDGLTENGGSMISTMLCNIIPAIGDGYIVQGNATWSSYDDVIGGEFGIFWKIDENGDTIWRKTSDTSSNSSIVSNGIGRYYCIDYDIMTVFDVEMNMIGNYRFYPANGFHAYLYDMQYVDDGLVFAGKIGNQAVVLKTDFEFNVIWQSDPFGAMGQARSVEPFGDGWISLSSRVFAEINAIGDTLWTYYDSINNTLFYDCTVSANSSIYLLGLYKLWKVDVIEHTLDLVAANTPGYDIHGAIDILPNGNIVYTGGRSDTGPILHSYSPDGTHQWSRSYNTFGAIYFGRGSKNLLVMPDGSILFCMSRSSNAVVIKTDAEGNVVANDDPITPVAMSSIMCYPQPASSEVMISVKSDQLGDLGYSIYNIRGQRVYSGKINGHLKEQSFKLPYQALDHMPSGIYLISLDQGNRKIATTKLVVVK